MTGAFVKDVRDDFDPSIRRIEDLRENIHSQEKAVLCGLSRSNSAPQERPLTTHWDVSQKAFPQVKEDITCLREKIYERSTFKYKKDHIDRQCRASTEREHIWNLVKDIAVLEAEVAQLEQYLLSLYRKMYIPHAGKPACAVEQHLSTPDIQASLDNRSQLFLVPEAVNKKNLSDSTCIKRRNLTPSRWGKTGFLPIKTALASFRELNEYKGVNKSSVLKKGVSSSYSQPILSSIKETKAYPSPATWELWREVISANSSASCINSCASVEPIIETPNKLSEELVRCMAVIYCKLADPPLCSLGGGASPSSSIASIFTAREVSSDRWRSVCGSDMSQSNTRHLESRAKNEFMVEIHWICVTDERLKYASKMLQKLWSLVQQLGTADLGQMQHEEKLAFWINIYNALLMHTYLAYGIPRSRTKQLALLQKAVYKVGAHSVSAHMIERNILCCPSSHHPVQWIQSLVWKVQGPFRQTNALEKPEPLVLFALCSGGCSDPAVRVYTPKNVYGELDLAQRDFLRANLTIYDDKILLPRIVETFARESSMSSSNMLDWIRRHVTEKQRLELDRCRTVRLHKCIEWTAYSFNFGYRLARDLVRWFPPDSV